MSTHLTEEIFHRVVEAPAAERERVLERETGGDPALHARLRLLVRAWQEEEAGEGASPERAPMLPPAEEEHPLSVGPYVVESVIAEGGTSIVYLARQARPSRQVALKVVRAWLASPGALARFALEAELVGRLRHPGVATVYEAGVADAAYQGGRTRPCDYIAMEYIDGLALTAHVRTKGLRARECAVLMARVCDAVHAAHQRGVIHRDLKPANILVTTDGDPKVLDFGAGALRVELDAELGRLGAPGNLVRMGTGPYISPEHILPGAVIDTRSDVYTLGVILHELLVGRTPFDDGLGPAWSAGREGKGTPEDLTLIMRRAIAPEPAQRYQSAAELAEDLRRFVRQEPVNARPRSVIYEARLFARRHTAVVGVALLSVCALAATTGIAINEATKAVRNERVASVARSEAEAATEFLEQVLVSASPLEYGRDVRVRDVVEMASARVESSFVGRPGPEARVREAIGRTLYGGGEFRAAERHLARAYELRVQTLGIDDVATARCGLALAAALGSNDQADEAATLYARCLETLRARLGETDPLTVQAMTGRGTVELSRQRFEAGLEYLREAAAAADARGGSPTSVDYHAMSRYASALKWCGDTDEAQRQYARALEGLRRTEGDAHPWTLMAMSEAAELAGRQGQSGEAETLLRQLAAVRGRVLGPEHADTLSTINALGVLLLRRGDAAGARTIFEDLLGPATAALGPDGRSTLKTRFNIAQTWMIEGNAAECLAVVEPLLARQREVFGMDHIDIVDSLHLAAIAELALGEEAPAIALFDESIGMGTRLLGETHPVMLRYRMERAAALTAAGRHEPVIEDLTRVAHAFERLGDGAGRVDALERVALSLEAVGRAEEARAMRELVARLQRGMREDAGAGAGDV